jgi:hypothetical protein
MQRKEKKGKGEEDSEPEGRQKEQPGHTLKMTHPDTAVDCWGGSLGSNMNGKGGLPEGRVCVLREEGRWQELTRKNRGRQECRGIKKQKLESRENWKAGF